MPSSIVSNLIMAESSVCLGKFETRLHLTICHKEGAIAEIRAQCAVTVIRLVVQPPTVLLVQH